MNISQITFPGCDVKIQELDSVILLKDCPDQALMKGDMGAVVMVHVEGKAFEVELVTLAGDTLGMLTLTADEVWAISARDMPHVRVA
jgi:hypothetical protein